MAPIVLDTNVYLFALNSTEGAGFFEQHFRPLVFRTYLASVVVEELYAGALDDEGARLVDRHLGVLERASRVVTPLFQDWKEAGKLVARITRKAPGRKPKVQQMLNDILLALAARRIGADLYTFNRDDFELIRQYKAFSLKILRRSGVRGGAPFP